MLRSCGCSCSFREAGPLGVSNLKGELDIHEDLAVDFPVEARTLFNLSDDPRKLDIIPGTADHGSDLLGRDSLNTSIREWILERIPIQ